jgi:CO/xanthine dehydrogenase FAD-binding subunit
VDALHRHGPEAVVLAGGQSLVPLLNLRWIRPSTVVDIGDADPRPPSVADGMLRLPALTRQRALVESPLVRQHCPLLAEAARHIGNIRVRTRGTLGGSLAHADPAAELGVAALALDARITLLARTGPRTVPAHQFFLASGGAARGNDEVITDVDVATMPPDRGWSFLEMVRRGNGAAMVAVAATVDLAEDRGVTSVRLALGGVAERVTLVDKALLDGLTESTVDDVAATVAGSLSPPSDLQTSGAHRKHLVAVLTGRALRQALGRATGAQP